MLTGINIKINVIFFLLGFGIFAGRAGQAGVLYCFGVFLPVAIFWGRIKVSRFPFYTLGFLLLGLFFVFPVADSLQLFVADREMKDLGMSTLKMMRSSQFSSAVFLTGLSLVLVGMGRHFFCESQGHGSRVSRASQKCESPRNGCAGERRLGGSQERILQAFSVGVGLATCVLLVYCFVQFFTGFNFSTVAAYRTDRLMGAFYRVVGFTNHPVSFANVSLIIFSFYWTLLIEGFWRLLADSPSSSYAEFKSALRTKLYAFIAGSHGLLIVLSGSRMALVVLIIMTLMIVLVRIMYSQRDGGGDSEAAGLLHNIYRQKKPLIWTLLLVGAACFIMSLYYSGIYFRFLEVFSGGRDSGFGDRLAFWQVHWQIFADSPWIGQGHLFLEKIVRLNYYNALGFGTLGAKYNAHNLYLEILADAGTLGLAAVGLIGWWVYSVLGRMYDPYDRCDDKILWEGIRYAWLSGMLFGLTQNSFFDTPPQIIILGLAWMLLWRRVERSCC